MSFCRKSTLFDMIFNKDFSAAHDLCTICTGGELRLFWHAGIDSPRSIGAVKNLSRACVDALT